jgi:hypothetical protein
VDSITTDKEEENGMMYPFKKHNPTRRWEKYFERKAMEKQMELLTSKEGMERNPKIKFL